jgi:hypothetical protein
MVAARLYLSAAARQSKGAVTECHCAAIAQTRTVCNSNAEVAEMRERTAEGRILKRRDAEAQRSRSRPQPSRRERRGRDHEIHQIHERADYRRIEPRYIACPQTPPPCEVVRAGLADFAPNCVTKCNLGTRGCEPRNTLNTRTKRIPENLDHGLHGLHGLISQRGFNP